MEEVVQTLAEEGVLAATEATTGWSRAPTELHISPTVQGVLAARIDRLAPEEKALLQQLAVIGREFPLSLIRQVIAQPEDELYRVSPRYSVKSFSTSSRRCPKPTISSSTPSPRRWLTARCCKSDVKPYMSARPGDRSLYRARLDEHYSELAHHYTRSGNTEKAVEYLHLAGQQAVQRSANVEAITHLTTALELLNTLPDTRERAQQELSCTSLWACRYRPPEVFPHRK